MLAGGSECGVGMGDGAGDAGEPTDGTGRQSPPVGGPPRGYEGGPPSGGVFGASGRLTVTLRKEKVMEMVATVVVRRVSK